MSQTVYIPFNIKLDPGEDAFAIDIPKDFQDRKFEFQTLTLIPDLYRLQALEMKMDDEATTTTTDDVFVELKLKHKMYSAHQFVSPVEFEDISSVLQYLNTFFESNKPEGMLLPPVVFDWILIDVLNMNLRETFQYYAVRGQELYGEIFSSSKHGGFVSPQLRDAGFSYFKYPTMLDVQKKIRVRMTLMPNVACSFSNDHLLHLLGFSNDQTAYGKHEVHFRYINSKTNSQFTTIADYAPKSHGPNVVNTTVFVYPLARSIQSPMYTFTTTNARNVNQLIEDYSETIQTMASDLNLNLSLEFEEDTHRVKLQLPSDIQMTFRLPPKMAHRLGFGHVSHITQDSVSIPHPPMVALHNVGKISKIQSFDTGMVMVTLANYGSTQTQQFINVLMAVLEPQSGGCHTTRIEERPQITVSQFNPRLEFKMSRFNETNQPVPLDWKCGAFVRGVLRGGRL